MAGTIIREGNRQFVKVKYSVDEDDVHFRQYPIPTSENLFKEGDLAKDVMDIVMVFSARMYGSRSHKNKQIVQQLKEIANNAI